jgi:hypothetical protein
LSYVEKLKEEITKAEADRKLFSSQLKDIVKMEEVLRFKLCSQDAKLKALRADLERFKE